MMTAPEKAAPQRARIAIVTGGAEGIGRSYCQRLAADGHDIIVIDRLSAEATGELVAQAGRRFDHVLCDLEQPDSIAAAVEAIQARHGGCDVLVNNAGIGSQRSLDQIGSAEVRQLLAVNLEAPFLLAKAFVPAMRARGWGRIINITTGALNVSFGGFVDYLMSKGGMLGLTRSLASDVGADGITVNAVAPGLVRTPMTLGGREGFAPLPDAVFDAVMSLQSVKRSQQPQDLVGAISFLASDDSALITGQVIYCDGGIVRV